ncbi:MAG: helix-turn-helix domain-containing protein, partial [Bacteroidota bacterium]
LTMLLWQKMDFKALFFKRITFTAALLIVFTFQFFSCNKSKPKDIFIPNYTPEQARLMDSLQKVSARYYILNPDSAEFLYDYMIRIMDSLHHPHQKFYILMDKVEFYLYRKPDFLKSYRSLLEAMSIFISNPDAYISSTYSFIDIGNFFFRNNQNDQALKFYRVAISISKQYQKYQAEGIALQNIGLVYLRQNNQDSAVGYFNKAHKILSDTIYITEAQNYLYLGKIAIINNKPDSALYFGGKCKQMLMSFQQGNHNYSANTKSKLLVTSREIECEMQTLLYQIYLARSMKDSSDYYFNLALNLSIQARSNANLTELYLTRLFKDPSVNNLSVAILCADSSLYHAEKLKDPYTSSATADSIAYYFSIQPSLDLSKKYSRHATQLNDSLKKLVGSQSFIDSRILLSSVVAEQVIRSQNIENKVLEEKLLYHQIFTVIGIFFVIGLAVIIYYIRSQHKDLQIAYLNLSKRIRQSIKLDSPDPERNHLLPETTGEIIAKLEAIMATEKIHIDKKITLTELAKRLNTNKSYLSAILNNTYEMNFNDFINQWRVKEACTVLMNPESAKMSMDQIAELSGFNSRSAFYKAFKKFTGMSPVSFIKTIPQPKAAVRKSD